MNEFRRSGVGSEILHFNLLYDDGAFQVLDCLLSKKNKERLERVTTAEKIGKPLNMKIYHLGENE